MKSEEKQTFRSMQAKELEEAIQEKKKELLITESNVRKGSESRYLPPAKNSRYTQISKLKKEIAIMNTILGEKNQPAEINKTDKGKALQH